MFINTMFWKGITLGSDFLRKGGTPSEILLPRRVKKDFHFDGERLLLLAHLLIGSSITVWYFSGKHEGPPPIILKINKKILFYNKNECILITYQLLCNWDQFFLQKLKHDFGLLQVLKVLFE